MKKKKLLYMIFSPAPSSVVRAKNYKDILLEKGYDLTFYYDYSNIVVNLLQKFSGKILLYPLVLIFKVLYKAIKIIKRALILYKIHLYDGIVIIKYIDSAFLKSVKSKAKGKLLYDFDDAVWLPSFMGEAEFEKLITSVDYVSCDNSYLRDKALVFNKNAFVLNGPAQTEIFDKYIIADNHKKNDQDIIIGWVGSPSTLFYLYSIYDILEIIGERYSNIKLRLLGVGNDELLIPQFDKIKVDKIKFYNQSIMVEVVKTFDIGLYPLFYNELSLGRGSLKATIYMGANVPAVCAGIGENNVIIQDNENGMLASTPTDWLNKLDLLINNADIRKIIANKGHDFVSSKYSLEACYNQLYNSFLSNL